MISPHLLPNEAECFWFQIAPMLNAYGKKNSVVGVMNSIDIGKNSITGYV